MMEMVYQINDYNHKLNCSGWHKEADVRSEKAEKRNAKEI